MNSRTIALATLLLTSTLFAKPTYLPPLELKSKASNDVQAFHYRIAIAWLTSGDYVISNNTISQDIDLRVYQNGVLLDASISAQNPFEVVDFTTTSSSDLTVEIHRYANSGSDNVILGYSFWNDL